MANSAVLSGSLVIGPQGAGDCGFPSGVVNITFTTFPPQKPAAVSAQHAKMVNTAAPGFATLDGIGPAASVTQALLLYLRTTAPFKLRLTMADMAGGPDIVSIVEVQGLLIQEFPTGGYLKLLEAQGVGTIEYAVAGNQ